MPFRRSGRLVASLLLITLESCLPGQAADDTPVDSLIMVPVPGSAIRVAGVGFSTPESVLHDPEADVYLVSTSMGMPGKGTGTVLSLA